jgi:ADP-ribose pyrophosphatase YjhB (NUDIX family)
LLLVKRGHEPGAGLWSLPGGRVEPGETDAEALVREMREETGLIVQPGPLVGSVRRPWLGGAVVEIRDYAATVTGGTLHPGDDAADARWVTPQDLNALPLTEGLAEILTAWGVLGQERQLPSCFPLIDVWCPILPLLQVLGLCGEPAAARQGPVEHVVLQLRHGAGVEAVGLEYCGLPLVRPPGPVVSGLLMVRPAAQTTGKFCASGKIQWTIRHHILPNARIFPDNRACVEFIVEQGADVACGAGETPPASRIQRSASGSTSRRPPCQ